MTLLEGPTAIDTSICLHCEDIAHQPFTLFGSEATVRPLRRFPEGGLRSGLLTVRPSWLSQAAHRLGSTLQFLVRHGSMRLGEREIGQNAFVVVPAGGILPPIQVLAASELLVIVDGPEPPAAAIDGDDAIVTPDIFAVDPIVPLVAGKLLHGFERRVLWLDPATGADTRLLRIPAGFEGAAGPNWHPVNEEIFCLEGDIAPDDSRPMRAGSFLWNPARAVHGFHEHSVGGCLLIEWHDGPWELIAYAHSE